MTENDSKNSGDNSSLAEIGDINKNSINPKGVTEFHNRKKALTKKDYVTGIRNGDRTILSRAITLIESSRDQDRETAREVIEACLPYTGNSVRVGITGVPGVGKSTFIETLGSYILDKGYQLAVLAIDPSSTKTKGSILGDKTRMESLSNSGNAFIRPSPTAGSLGGVARKTRETVYLCEAAGYDMIFIETVGVGQSETAVHSMVDFFLLLMLSGAGDELQGIKRGIIEMADLIAINKIDNSSEKQVQQAVREYKSAIHLYPEPESGWSPRVTTCSALEGDGVDEIWDSIDDYITTTRKNGFFKQKRNSQAKYWMYESITNRLSDHFFNHPEVKKQQQKIEQKVVEGKLSSFGAAGKLLDIYFKSLEKKT